MSGGHERRFMEEAGSSFEIQHEEYFSSFSSEDLVTVCRDLIKGFVASRCLARKLEQEKQEAKDSSTVATACLQTKVAGLEKLLALEQNRSKRLEQEKDDSVLQAVIESLRTDVEMLTSTKEDLSRQLQDKDTKLVSAKGEASRLNDVLERYQTKHIRSAEVLHNELLELLAQCNLEGPPTSFPQCTSDPFTSE
jgi:predicted RNase H-like nuclease (RuvC/YqgF family)